jgi:ribosomal protein S18 acetylase RimI-like enzyme
MVADSEAVRLADRNYAHAYRLMGRHSSAGKVYEEPGLLAAITGPILWLNVCVVYDTLADPAASIGRALDFYKQANMPFIMRIRVDYQPETQAAMRALGLQAAAHLPGMILNPASAAPPHPELEIRDWDEPSLPAHNEIIAASFGMSVEMVNGLIKPEFLTSDFKGYVGYLDGVPVATSALLASDGVAGVYNVATLPAYRKRGLGEAMTWHAVREGLAAGCQFGSLQASEMGQPIYARMGFRNIAPYESYILGAQG